MTSINPFGHVDLRVKNLQAALPFYAAVLPALGFRRSFDRSAWKIFATLGEPPGAAYFAITEEREHQPNRNRIAFWVPSREAVDRLAVVVQEAGGRITAGPQLFPQFGPSYYALYFEDPSGNCLEIVYRAG